VSHKRGFGTKRELERAVGSVRRLDDAIVPFFWALHSLLLSFHTYGSGAVVT